MSLTKALSQALPKEAYADLIRKGLEYQFAPDIHRKLEELVTEDWRDNTLLLWLVRGLFYHCSKCGRDVEARRDFRGGADYEVHWCPTPGCKRKLSKTNENVTIGKFVLLFLEGGTKIELVSDWERYGMEPSIVCWMTDDTLWEIFKGRKMRDGSLKRMTPYEEYCEGKIVMVNPETTENWIVHMTRLSLVLNGVDVYLRREFDKKETVHG